MRSAIEARLLGLAGLAICVASLAARAEGTDIAVIPRPGRVEMKQGRFRFQSGMAIAADAALTGEARFFARSIAPALGFAADIRTPRSGSAPHTEMRLNPSLKRLGDAGYRLDISPQRILLTASNSAGIFYGTQTLRQLMPVQVYRDAKMAGVNWSVPCLAIEDTPRFKWRGALLDVSRHFMPNEFVKKFIDLLAMHKLNSFQWHLTDDNGWRIEIRKYSKLTETGSWRKASPVGRIKFDDWKNQELDGVPHFGYYTQEDVREIVAYAQERHVNVVPEIEMPGHSQAAVAAYPELGSLGMPVPVLFNYDHADQLNMNESTIRFLLDVLSEVIELFPSPYIHVGGDEVLHEFWTNSPRVQARMKELGISSTKKPQGYFTRRLDEFLTSKGRKLVGWDEILEGGVSKNAVVMSWRGERGGIEATAMEHDVIMAPIGSTDFNWYQGGPAKEPLTFEEQNKPPQLLVLKDVYSYDPMPAAIAPKHSHHVLGAQCQLWTEYIPNPKMAEYMTFPRLCALAEVVWTPKERKNYSRFVENLTVHLERLDALDVKYRKLEPKPWERVK